MLKLLKVGILIIKWLELMQENYMQGPVGKLLYQIQGFLFNYHWEPIWEQDSDIALKVMYKVERFKTQK
jgi:hypothetical protein